MTKIWLITVGEPLPTNQDTGRLYRTGLLAEYLSSHEHEVVWWTSSFDHTKKRPHDSSTSEKISINPFLTIRFLYGMSYQSNLSFKRILNHIQLVLDFKRKSKRQAKPDLILCSYPTVGLSHAAVQYARYHKIPIAIDIRDLWPEAIVNLFPKIFKPLIKSLLCWNFQQSRFIFRHATSIIGISDKYLEYGLKKSRRTKSTSDHVFPLGYPKLKDKLQMTEQEQFFATHNIDPNKFICWFVGYFGRTYDLKPIIETAKRLTEQNQNNIQFVLSGTGDKYAYWQDQTKNCNNIILTGWVDKLQIISLGKIAKLGLQAYAADAPQGLANKLFEYLSFGLPVLSSLKGENEELLDKYQIGLTYNPLDPNSFYEKLQQLYSKPSVLDKMSHNAKNLFENQFDNATINQELERHLTGLVKN